MHKLTPKRIPLAHVRFVEAQTHAFAALADMPIKHRNVLLPALTPTLQDAVALTARLRQAHEAKSLSPEAIASLAGELATTLQALTHGFEMALRLKALPQGRVALVVESLSKALP